MLYLDQTVRECNNVVGVDWGYVTPININATSRLFCSLLTTKRTKNAYTVCLIVRRLKADYVDGWVAYANALVHHGRNEDAIIAMEQAMTLVNNDADMFNNYGVFYGKLGAVTMVVTGKQASLDYVGFHHKAATAYQQAISINPKHSIAMRNLARVQRSLGRHVEAEELYKK